MPEVGAVGACLVPPDAGAAPDPSPLDQVDLWDAVVLAEGQGAPPSGCLDVDTWHGTGDQATDSGRVPWLELQDSDGQVWTLSLMVGGGALAVADDDVVDLRWEWDPDSALAVELRADDGRLLAWVGRDVELEGLSLPAELLVTEGVEVQACAEECGTVRDLGLSVEIEGQGTELSWDDVDEAGDWVVAQAGTVFSDDAACKEGDCPLGSAVGAVRVHSRS